MAAKRHLQTNKKEGPDTLRVVELFAGVGGFRLGLCGKNDNSKNYRTVWFNQWEPGSKKQHAHDVYKAKFEEQLNEETRFTNVDIAAVVRMAQTGQFNIPDHDLLVGGFPCQDYSVARTLSQAKGIAGKKGVLWWEIRNILELKQKEGKPVKYLFLENVDRLLKSPASQRGRDFSIILATLADLGYAVEWRVVNAADYGMPQRRRRIFILAYHSSTAIYRQIHDAQPHLWLTRKGVLATAFPVVSKKILPSSGNLIGSYANLTEKFNLSNPSESPFHNSGLMVKRVFHSLQVTPAYKGAKTILEDVLITESEVPETFFIAKKELAQWKYLKGAKKEKRKGANGFIFTYNEGPMIFPDPLDRPSRTIITGEGGPTPSRFKHVVKTKKGLRRLTPIELERLCMFPDKHTELSGVSDVRRAFFMGNALVVGAIERIGKALTKFHKNSAGNNRLELSGHSLLSPLSLKATGPNRHRAPTKSS